MLLPGTMVTEAPGVFQIMLATVPEPVAVVASVIT
jgi:hypothetical protein